MPAIELLDKFIIDRRRGSPMHAQILRALRKMIDAHFADGDPFFTEMEIVARLGVSRATVRQALGELSREGILLRRPSVGTVVTKNANASGGPLPGPPQDAVAQSRIGVVIPEYDSELTAMLLQKIVEEGRRHSHAVQVYYTHRGEDLQRAFGQIHHGPDQERFILCLPPSAALELSEALWDSGYRTVSIDAPSRPYPGAVVETDARMAVQMGVDYLRSLGHRQITLLVNEPADRLSVQEKVEQFRQAQPQGRVVVCGTHDWENSYAAAYAHMPDVWETTDGVRPTAIMTVSDPGAWAALRWLAERGLAVPGAVSVLGFEDARSSQFMHPSLSTIAHPIEAIARTAVEMLRQAADAPRERRLPPQLIVRESTGPAPD